MQKKTPPCQTEGTQTHLASSAVQSQRVELSQTNCPVQTQNAATVQRQTSSVQLERIKVEPDEAVSEADATPNLLIEKSAEPCVKSESSDTILDGYAVIGLHCVVECRRKEDGRSSCFLCHCCRVKSDPGDIIDHLTSSTHISNYLESRNIATTNPLLAASLRHLERTLTHTRSHCLTACLRFALVNVDFSDTLWLNKNLQQ
ncbi:hypothetical protein N1851_023438 [Merluccius polli]|uniref:Uncharacterized protein n=1 Tax=Merluccius polli TaxID=89951 RepID=A0AA47MGF9_MERPO|nr:hypothetical protein N1851_023438 [Merluccius polli]